MLTPPDSIVSMNQNMSPPPYTIRPSEIDPLIPRKASRRHIPGSCDRLLLTVAVALLAVTITSAIFFSVFPISSCNNPLDPDVRDRIRKEWDVERRQHQDIEHRWRVEENARTHVREQWMRETEEHERKLSEALRRENQEKQVRRSEWEREVERHNREVRERREREERERLRLKVFWTDQEAHACTTYGTREYTARLVNVPANYDHRVEACMNTPIKIHGTEYKAKWCEDHGSSNLVGHWEVDQYEPECTSYWNGYKDLGCGSSGSGQRHVEHHLENLPSGGDWMEFCATTPASFRGMHFMGAQFCSRTILGAVYGHWVFDDESCNYVAKSH